MPDYLACWIILHAGLSCMPDYPACLIILDVHLFLHTWLSWMKIISAHLIILDVQLFLQTWFSYTLDFLNARLSCTIDYFCMPIAQLSFMSSYFCTPDYHEPPVISAHPLIMRTLLACTPDNPAHHISVYVWFYCFWFYVSKDRLSICPFFHINLSIQLQ